ncbi:MAG: trypsin-like peptidase domain-containing protein [Spirochaetia bacterium]|nr:trypsin-like peptidase domain-containing protein [Spirochaetia bacterium]
MKRTALIMAALMLASIAAFAGNADIERATVKIFTVSNTPDFTQPWQMLGQSRSTGSGCIISGNRILTNAHVISNRMFIQVLKNGETEKYVADVVAVDHDCDLAVLTVKDKTFFNGVKPVNIGNLPKLGNNVKVFGFPLGGEKLSITEGVVSRIEVTSYSHSYESFLTVQIDAAINPGNSGGPVISDGKLVGVAFQCYDFSQSIGYAIPASIVKSFLGNINGKSYRGFPTLGVSTQNLENESYREKLGMTKKQSGVIVNTVEYNASCWDVLKQGDVILSIDGVRVANDGTVPFGSLGRIDLSYIVKTKKSGEKLKMTILRDKKVMKVEAMLRKQIPVIYGQLYDVKPVYYVFGGVVFIPLNGNYLQQMWGSWGERKQPANLMNRMLSEYSTPEKQEIIIVRQVLADETNVGYEDFRNLVVTSVNGAGIRDMRDLIAKIEGSKENYLEIELEGRDKIVLDAAKSREASPGILGRYQVEFDRSENLRVPELPGVLK